MPWRRSTNPLQWLAASKIKRWNKQKSCCGNCLLMAMDFHEVTMFFLCNTVVGLARIKKSKRQGFVRQKTGANQNTTAPEQTEKVIN